jgi:ABC-type glycerol-3-phosphate transport system permease component
MTEVTSQTAVRTRPTLGKRFGLWLADLRHHPGQMIWLAIALALAVSFAFPLYFMISSSFKAESEVLAIPVHWTPQDFQGLLNYQRALETVPLARYFMNSFLMAGIDMVVTVIFSAMAGYGFAKFDFPLKRLFFVFVLSTIMVPFQILLVPLFIEIHSLGWDDSYAGLIIPGIMNAFGVFMMRQFAYAIPDELMDAARMDGASEPRIFAQIVFPLLSSASASLAVIIFLFSWNNFLWPLIVIKSEEITTVPVGITVFTQPHSAQPQWAVAMAVSTLATLPVMLLFVFFQRYFIEGFVLSGLKG